MLPTNVQKLGWLHNKWYLTKWSVVFLRLPRKISKSCKFQKVLFSSVAQLCPILCDPMNRSTPGLPVHHQLLEFAETSIESVMPSSHLILCHPLLLLPSIFPSFRIFSNEPALRIRWPKYWSFSLNIVLPMNTQD